MKALFVTATGTGIGKTFATAALTHQLRARGLKVRAFKPIVTGLESEPFARSDPGILLDAMGITHSTEHLDWISPIRFAAPLAPSMAAAREGKTLDVERLVALCRAAMEGDEDIVLIEGVGGVMVPLAGRLTVLDWMAALQIPVLLVTGSYLGTLSHSLTAREAIARRKIALAGLVVSETPGSAVPLDETVRELRLLIDEPVMALPRAAGWRAARDLTALVPHP